MPAQAGIQASSPRRRGSKKIDILDSRLRGNDNLR
jgi:hypothetical protein